MNIQNLLNGETYLPIGSVVLLKNSERKVMIIGVLQFDGNDQSKLYDYSGVLYPEGLMDPKQNFLFDKDKVEDIFHLGYINDEQEALQKTIKLTVEKYEASRK
jgi:hypothetical protein